MPTITEDPENPNIKHLKFSDEELRTSTGIVVPDETPIIRYMSLSKFYSLLASQSLWFPRVDQFSDEYEGLAILDTPSEDADYFRKLSLVSCWNYFLTESFPLWKIYLGNEPAGIGLVSTVGDFKLSLKNEDDREHITPYQVQYVNPDETYDGINNMLLVTRKKNFYEYENEIRFNYYTGGGNFEQPVGRAIQLEPKQLINKVILSPYMPFWIRSTFEDIIKKYGLGDIQIAESIVKDKMLK